MNLARLTARFIGQPYQLGAVDCLSTVLDYLESTGHPLPQEFEGHTRASALALFLIAPAEAKQIMIRLIDSLLPSIPTTSSVAGDILLLRLAESPPFLAIDGGNGNVIAASEQRGVSILPRRHYSIGRAWRCQQQSL